MVHPPLAPHRYTMDSFCEIAFGEEVDTLRNTGHAFAPAFDALQESCMKRFFDPLWKIKRMLGVGVEADIKRYNKVLDDFCSDVVARRRQDLHKKLPRTDLITMFMKQAAKEKRELGDKELRDIIINFMVAGRDTTAVALSWFMFEMAKQPDILEKVVADVDAAIAAGDPSGEIDYRTAERMRYTEAALMETLRLHPSVPGDSKQAVGADVLPDGTPVPAGCQVSYSPYCFGRSEKLWDEPNKLLPERWLSGGSESAMLHDAKKSVWPSSLQYLLCSVDLLQLA